jgi:hypothetical protein
MDLTGGGKTQSVPLALPAAGPEWRTIRIPLRCFDKVDLGAVTSLLRIHARSPMTVALSDVRLLEAVPGDRCPAS